MRKADYNCRRHALEVSTPMGVRIDDYDKFCEVTVRACLEEYDRLTVKIPDRQLKILRNFLWFAASIAAAQAYLFKFHIERWNLTIPLDLTSLIFIISILLSVVNICIGIRTLTNKDPFSFPFAKADGVFIKSLNKAECIHIEHAYSEMCKKIESANNMAIQNISHRYKMLKIIQFYEILCIFITAVASFSSLLKNKEQIGTIVFALMFLAPIYIIIREE